MKERILDIINDVSFKKMKLVDFKEALGSPSDYELKKALDELVYEGYLFLGQEQTYILASKKKIFRGKINIKKQGFGFLDLDDQSIFISKDNINGAFDGDIVVVKALYAASKELSLEGKVLRVVERATNFVVGRFLKGEPNSLIEVENQRFDCLVGPDDTLGAITDHIVKAEIIEYGFGFVKARVIKILGYVNDPGMDILSVCYQYDLQTSFSDDIYEEAALIADKVSAEEIKKRIDRRSEKIVTIDGEDAKDLDDAISVKRLDNGNFFLGVYIADVSYYVKRDSKIDQEAYLRGTSVYLVDRVIPMLPERLCNGICSLNEGVDRLAIACEMEIDSNGCVVSENIFPTVINSSARMTYTNVNKILEHDEELINKYHDLVPMFFDMNELSNILINARVLRGSIEFETKEPKIRVDENGFPLEIYLKPRGISEGIIEEFMLKANETVAKKLCQLELPFIYRVHETPDKKKIERLLNVIKNMGYSVSFLSKDLTPKDCQHLLSSLEGKKGADGINILLLRSMMKARYSEECLGHYGLALKYYTHFTSPIRRYPDTLVHRMIREFLFENKTSEDNIHYWINHLPDFSLYTSRCEKTAVDCEREVISMKMAEYMSGFIGKHYEGLISSLTSFGMFVELENGVEGLIHIGNIDYDFYEFDEQRMIIVGQRSKRYFQLGDKLIISVKAASKTNRTVDFNLVKAIDNHKIVTTNKAKKKKGGKHEKRRRK